MTRVLTCLVAVGMLACAQRAPETDREDTAAADCVPVTGPLESAPDPMRLVGSYDLVFVVTRGSAAGHDVDGRLTLRAADGDVVGSASISIADLGAEPAGDVGSTDPAAPGARAVAGNDIVVVRLGADANRASNDQAIEGPGFALQVRRIDDSGFAGTWVSGLGMGRAEGHFCARRS